MIRIISLFFVVSPLWMMAQPNCNIYESQGDSSCYQACLLASAASEYQGHRQSQIDFDKAIELCPSFAYAYFAKSIPYLKRGDFITWKKLINKAVEFSPLEYLGYRGWCRYQFLRDYHGAISDIEQLDTLVDYDIGYSQNGNYHLNFAKAFCYKALGKRDRAIEIMENQLSKKGYSPMPYDYLHLGVTRLETGDVQGAIAYFEKQIAYNDFLAETYYYMAKACQQLNLLTESKQHLNKAREFYKKQYRLADPYTHPIDKIYLADIDNFLSGN